jgi:hypothetical protein
VDQTSCGIPVRSAIRHSRLPCPLVVIAALVMTMGETLRAEEPSVAPSNESGGEEKVRELDLRAPDITEIYTREQIEAFLVKSANEDKNEAVEVESTRERPPNVTPNIWPGIAAPFWALLHPSQAWRILVPLPPDQTRGKEKKPDATDPENLPPMPDQMPFR